MWQSWISFVLGVWLILSGLISGLQGSVSMILTGILIALIGYLFLKGWEGMVNGILGLWLLISGIISGFVTVQNYLVIGILITVISLIRIFHVHRRIETKHETV